MAATSLPPPVSSELPLTRPSELERALDDDVFFISFLDFCKQEHNAENILFWRAVCDFDAVATDLGDPTSGQAAPEEASEAPPEQVVNAQLAVARGLLVKYIRAGAAHEVNMREETRSEVAIAVQDRDIFTLRKLLQRLRSKALEDMMTDIIPRFRKSSNLKEYTSNTSKSKSPTGLSTVSMLGSRRHTITGGVLSGGAADEGSALAPASVSPDAAGGAGGTSGLRAGASAGAGDGFRSQKLSEWTVSKAVRHLGKRRRMLGVSIRVAPSVKAKEAIAQVVTACKANILREGFLHKRGGSKQSWKRRWCILSKEIGAAYRPSDDHEEAEEAEATATSSPAVSAAASSASPSPTPADDDDAGAGGVLLSSIPGMPALPGSAEAKASQAAKAAAEEEAASIRPLDLPAMRTRKLADVGDGKGGSVKTSELRVEWVPAKRRSGGILLWFDDDKQPLPKGMIALAEVRGLVPDLSSFLSGAPFGFGLVTRRRLFVLQAVSKRTLGRWLDSMRLVLGLPLSASASPLARSPSEVGVFSRSRSVSRPKGLARAQSSRVMGRHSMAPIASSSTRSIPPFLAEAPAKSKAAGAGSTSDEAGSAKAGSSRLASSQTRHASSFDGAPAHHSTDEETGASSSPQASPGLAPPPPAPSGGSQTPSPPPPPSTQAVDVPSPPPPMPDASDDVPSPPPPMPDASDDVPSPPPPMPDASDDVPSPPPPMPDAPPLPPTVEDAVPPPPAPVPPAPAVDGALAAESKGRGGRKRLKGRVVKKADESAAAE